MSRIIGMRFLYLLGIFFTHQLLAQCSINELSLDKKIDNSTNIIEGKVIEIKSFYNPQHTFIYTAHKVEVYKNFKGNISTKNIYIITNGGTVENKHISASSSTKLDTGSVGLFLVNPSTIVFPFDSTIQTYKMYGGIQGVIKYNLKDKTASTPFKNYKNINTELYRFITNKLGENYNILNHFDVNNIEPYFKLRSSTPVISSFSPTVTSAGTYSVLTINGSGFGTTRGNSSVNFMNTDDGGKTYIQPFQNQYIYWSNTKIKVQVPSTAGTGPIQIDVGATTTSTDTLFIDYAELNVNIDDSNEYQTNIVGLNYEGGITWRMNVDVNDNSNVKESFIRALSTWKCNTFINWKLGATTLVNKTKFDSINVITFGETSDLADGTLAVCYSYWGQCNTSDWILQEADVIINPNANWDFGPGPPEFLKYDFESVILHELGHGHQLAHVIDKNDLMNYSIGNGEVKRILRPTNIAGANDILNRSSLQNFCNFPPTNLLSASNCADLYIENKENDFLIFPNPSSGFFNIAIPDVEQKLTIKIYTSLGSLLTTLSPPESSSYVAINLSEYIGGVYFLVIENGVKTITRKIILTK